MHVINPLPAATSCGTTTDTASVIDWRDEPDEHTVQFYEDERVLVSSVVRFAREGLLANDRVILIATKPHLAAIEAALVGDGIDLRDAGADGRYVTLDAEATLGLFMVEGAPDPARFHQHVGTVVAAAGQRGRRVRAFGEMVALLWMDGARDAALQLETLWNDLGRNHHFALHCAYPMKNFADDAQAPAFLHVCALHSRVVPAESFNPQGAMDERMRTIATLQQKAVALETEIAERRRAEDALRRRKEELTAFVENACVGLNWVGPDGLILWANGAEMEMLGYERNEYIGHHIAEFHADKQAVDDILARLCRGERLRGYEARLRCKDGGLRTVLMDSSIFWDNGRFVHSQCFTRDITDQKRTEQQLASARDALSRANEELERQVFERTASLREAVAQLEEFSYTVSHDLRAPLRGMQVYSQALLEDHAGNLDAEARHCLLRIAENSSRLDRMITDVLAFSRVSRNELQLQRVSLTQVVREVIATNPSMRAPRATVQVETLHDVLGHTSLVEQAISNLLSNAVKFVPVGEMPQVRVWDEIVDSGVRLWIEDNGIGVPPAVYHRLFRMFERLHPHLSYEGTGIGLAIVRKAVTRLNGDTGVEPNTPRGSRFWIRLPLA